MKRFVARIIVLATLLSGCGNTPDRPFTGAEIQQFLTQHTLQPLAVQTIDGLVTVIAWKTPTNAGCDMMTSYHPHVQDHYFGTRNALAASITTPDSGTRVVASHSSILLTRHEVVCMVMLDPLLQAEVKQVRVVFFDGTQQVLDVDNQAVIVASRLASTLSTQEPEITMYDAAGTLVLTVDPRTIR
ncbi:MAG TPA: hypothetical protein VD886_19700 [Herpetosiphonaceae bacterium]|nr:hypothetical protein [Herpetosiphonaceae bacterium]